MDGSPASRPVRLALARFRALGLPRGARVLALGAGLGERLRREGFDAPPLEPDRLELAPQSFDAAVIAGVLERDPWPRWTLQQAHAALRPGAPLVLVAWILDAAAALLDPAALATVVGKQVRRLGARRGAEAVPAPAPRGRQRAATLIATLAHLGYRLESRGSRLAEVVGGTLALTARRESALFGDPPHRPWPDPAAHRARFERDHRDMIVARERWLAAHPDAAGAAATPLDPARFAGANVLVLAPHPDDELLGCGGTLARLVAAGARVTVIQATDGAAAASLLDAPDAVRRRVRLDEAAAVGRAMGFAAVEAWGEPNGAFRARDELVARLARTLTTLAPALVFAPFAADVHPEHRVLARLLARALAALPRPAEAEVLAYAVWCLVPANRYAVVTAEMDAVARALALYVTAMKVEDYIHLAQDRNYWNAVALTGTRGFVEAFHAVPAADVPGVAATLEGADG